MGNRAVSDKKRIDPSLRPSIERVKSYIRTANRPFDGDGYVFKQALSEMRKEGHIIKYISSKCHYIKEKEVTQNVIIKY